MTRATMKQFAVFEESDDGREGEGNSGRIVKVLKKSNFSSLNSMLYSVSFVSVSGHTLRLKC